MYNMGGCQLGWSYMLAIASAAIGAFCPYLAQHVDVMLEGVDKNLMPPRHTGPPPESVLEPLNGLGPWDVGVEAVSCPHGPPVCDLDEWQAAGPVITASETNSSFKSTSTFSSFLNL